MFVVKKNTSDWVVHEILKSKNDRIGSIPVLDFKQAKCAFWFCSGIETRIVYTLPQHIVESDKGAATVICVWRELHNIRNIPDFLGICRGKVDIPLKQ